MSVIRPKSPQDGSSRSLIELHSNKSGKVSDKWASYFPAYERLFTPLRDRPLALLEIGVQNGGSLETWAEYFPRATRIIGCDIDAKCGSLTFDDPRIAVVVGNAHRPEVVARIAEISPRFDIVIDDGSHLSREILSAFFAYFPLLQDDGIYVVEDTHALYRRVPGGGVLSRTSAMEFFKLCAELTNLEHWAQDLSLEVLFSTFLPTAVPPWLRSGIIESVEFRNSMIVLRRGSAQLGERVIGGSEASVYPNVLRHKPE